MIKKTQDFKLTRSCQDLVRILRNAQEIFKILFTIAYRSLHDLE